MTDKLNPSPKLALISHRAWWSKKMMMWAFYTLALFIPTSFLILSCIPSPEFIIKSIGGWCIFWLKQFTVGCVEEPRSSINVPATAWLFDQVQKNHLPTEHFKYTEYIHPRIYFHKMWSLKLDKFEELKLHNTQTDWSDSPKLCKTSNIQNITPSSHICGDAKNRFDLWAAAIFISTFVTLPNLVTLLHT